MKKILRKLIFIISIIFTGIITINFLGGTIVYGILFSTGRNTDDNNYLGLITYSDIKDMYTKEELTFSSGSNKLQGYFYKANDIDKLIVFSHGIYDYAESLLPQQKYFLDHGYNVFSYDSSGCGKSEGNVASFSESLINLKSALEYLDETPKFKNYKKLLFGFSWGGYASASILNFKLNNVYASVSLSGYNDAKHLIINKGKDMVSFIADMGAPVINMLQNNRAKGYLDYTAISGINNSNIPVYLIHSKCDKTVSYRDSIINAYLSNNTSKNVKTYLEEKYDNEAINRHLYLQFSDKAIKYQMEIKNKLKNIKNETEKKAFYQTIDKKLYNELNDELFKSILDFYNASLKWFFTNSFIELS